jgi:hypothetical protein
VDVIDGPRRRVAIDIPMRLKFFDSARCARTVWVDVAFDVSGRRVASLARARFTGTSWQPRTDVRFTTANLLVEERPQNGYGQYNRYDQPQPNRAARKRKQCEEHVGTSGVALQQRLCRFLAIDL